MELDADNGLPRISATMCDAELLAAARTAFPSLHFDDRRVVAMMRGCCRGSESQNDAWSKVERHIFESLANEAAVEHDRSRATAERLTRHRERVRSAADTYVTQWLSQGNPLDGHEPSFVADWCVDLAQAIEARIGALPLPQEPDKQ